MTHSIVRLITLFVLGLVAASTSAADRLEAVVDRQTIGIDETLNFRLVYEGQQSNSDPDFAVLRQHFDVLSNQKSTQHSFINGKVSASTEWRLVLAPKSTGQLLIPPFAFEGLRSDPLTVTVTAASKDPVSGKEDVFLETFVDKSTVYVQEQFIVTYRLYYNRSVDSLDAAPLDLDNTRLHTLPRVDYQKTLGHTAYGVAEFKYAVFADASGNIEIPAQTWTVRTTDQPSMSRFGFNGGRFKLHRVKTKALSITVESRPDAYPANAVWLPAQDVTLEEHWSESPANFKVGEPITRTITLTATGAAAEQLSPLFEGSNSADFKFYPDKPSQDTQLNERGVEGTRTESVAIVPSRVGELTLPPVKVTWWNTERKQVEVASLPPRTITVAGAPVTAAPETNADQTEQQSPAIAAAPTMSDSATPWGWIVFSAALALSNIILMVFLFTRRTRQGANGPDDLQRNRPNDQARFKDVCRACQEQAPQALRNAIISWAKQRWGQQANTLSKLEQLGRDPVLSEQLHKLDATIFAGAADTIDYPLLQKHLEALYKNHDKEKTQSQLKPLYAPS